MGSTLKGKNLLSGGKEILFYTSRPHCLGNKQEVTKVVFLCKIAENIEVHPQKFDKMRVQADFRKRNSILEYFHF